MAVLGIILLIFLVINLVQYVLHSGSEWALLYYQPSRFCRHRILISDWPRILSTGILLFSLQIYYQLSHLIFFTIVPLYILMFFPYLTKSTKFILCCLEDRRGHLDKLMVTSLIYLISSATAVYLYRDYEYGYLCVITTIGSLLYHRFREARFFNFDNIFATIHFVVYSVTLTDAYTNWDGYFFFGITSFPLALFSLVYCGSPATILALPSSAAPSSIPALTDRSPQIAISRLAETKDTIYERASRQIYDDWHLVWHLTSGVGPLLSLYYLHNYFQPKQISVPLFPSAAPWIVHQKEVYYLALLISMTFNWIANKLGVIPLD